jgi:hypothetical protein
MRPSESLRIAGKPVAYFPQLVKPLGSVNASILFGHFFYWNDKGCSELGIYRTAEEIEEETGLSVQEQRTARAKLRKCGVLIETEKRIEHRIYYKLDLAVFDALMLQHSGSAESTAPKCKINIRGVSNQHSGSAESTAVIGTEDLAVDLTEDISLNRDISAPANADACVESVATAKPKKPTLAKQRKQDALQLLADHGVDGQLALDYLAVREDRKARTLTQTAIAGLEREAVRAGLTLAQAVTVCVERNWAGFNADWLHSSGQQGFRPQPARQSVKQIPQHTLGGAFLAKDIL